MTSYVNRGYEIPDQFRRQGVPVAMGGVHPSFMPQEALRHCDAVVIGEVELVIDKLPKTPSRKTPGPFGARIVIGAACGAALCVAGRQSSIIGAVMGALGAVVGTLGGYEARTRSVAALKAPDFVIALIEDAIAIGGGLLLVSHL